MKMPVFTISNTLSFIRAPLAFLFLQDNAFIRMIAILLAMFTDSIDGYLARRSSSATRFGAILDPAMDKFFVYFAMTIFYIEGFLENFEIFTMLSRDFFLILYGATMLIRKKKIVFRAIRWGKVTTALQFIVLITLSLKMTMPWLVYGTFLILGLLAYVELLLYPIKTSKSCEQSL